MGRVVLVDQTLAGCVINCLNSNFIGTVAEDLMLAMYCHLLL